jgi:drug/metabolite transporter (DMT)-like permease
MLLIVVLGLGSAVVYGASDFFGATAARRLNLLAATTVNYAVAVLVIALVIPVVGGRWSGGAFATGVVCGGLAVVGLLAFYGVLAIGPMSLLSPVIALVQSVVPVAFAALTGQALTPVAWVAIALAVVAILLLSPPRLRGGERISPRGALLALFSGLCLGVSLVALDFAPKDSGVIPAFWEIVAGLLVLLVLLLVFRIAGPRAPWVASFSPQAPGTSAQNRRGWIQAGAAGALAAIADALVVSGLHIGNLAVISVLVALYPVVTVILAATVLKERIAAVQYVGIALVIVASLLLTTA